jgi:predicted nucleotidyltransferase
MTLPSLGLAPKDIDDLLAILKQYAPGAEVWAFGSRVSGKPRPFSDLDVVIVQDKPLDAQTKAELHYELSESRLPVKVDVVEWARTTPSFRDIIQENHIVLKSKNVP